MTIANYKKHGTPHLVDERPRVLLSSSRAVYIGPGMQLSPHKLAVATIVIALSQPFELHFFDTPGDTTVRGQLALIPPDTLHHLKTKGLMVFLYLDPLSDDFAALDLKMLQVLEPNIAGLTRRAINEARGGNTARSQINAICDLFDLPKRTTADGRIASVMRKIESAPQEFTTIAQAAKIAGLSVPRFQHIFKEVAGTPFRRYRLWKRMAIVAHGLNASLNLTEAAYNAGFSSSAHLSAAFRDMFGIKPSVLLANNVRFELDLALD